MTMSANQWATQLLLGGLLGTLGQGVRVVVGLKKLNDQALGERKRFSEVFSTSTFLMSLLIGFIAGVLGVISSGVDLAAVTRQDVLFLIGIGYAGADFIEGFVRKNLPSSATAAAAPAVPPGGPAAGAADLSTGPDLQPPVG